MDIQISSIEGNTQMLDGGAMFGNAPRELWSKWVSPDQKGRIPLACRSLLIETGNEKILCEAGIGAFFEPQLAERFGVQNADRHLLLENLRHLGVSPEDITSVVLSHLHFDHAGGLLPTFEEIKKTGFQLVFPRAEFVVSQKAWNRALQPHPRDRASFIPELTTLLERSDRLKVIDSASPYRDYLSFIYSDGHTPGQMLAHVQGEQMDVIFGGDLVPGTAWIHVPITMGYDRYPELLIDEKLALYESMRAKNWLLFFTHDPETSACTIRKDEKGRFCSERAFAQIKRMPI